MNPCPRARWFSRGAHDFTYFVPPDNDHDIVAICDRCGERMREPMRRVVIDDLDAEQIMEIAERSVRGA